MSHNIRFERFTNVSNLVPRISEIIDEFVSSRDEVRRGIIITGIGQDDDPSNVRSKTSLIDRIRNTMSNERGEERGIHQIIRNFFEENEESNEEFEEQKSSEDDEADVRENYDEMYNLVQSSLEIKKGSIKEKIMDKYGPLGLHMYMQLESINMSNQINDCNSFLSNFTSLINKSYLLIGEEESKEKAKYLESLVPPISMLDKFNKFSNSPEKRAIVKLVIDLSEIKTKIYDYPLFESYIHQLIPYALKFFAKLSSREINEIVKVLYSQSSKKNISSFNVMKTRKDYINYYNKELNNIANASGGNAIELFYL